MYDIFVVQFFTNQWKYVYVSRMKRRRKSHVSLVRYKDSSGKRRVCSDLFRRCDGEWGNPGSVSENHTARTVESWKSLTRFKYCEHFCILITYILNEFCEEALYQISRRISLPCTRRDTKSYHRSVTVVIEIFQTDFLTSGTSGSYGICEICEICKTRIRCWTTTIRSRTPNDENTSRSVFNNWKISERALRLRFSAILRILSFVNIAKVARKSDWCSLILISLWKKHKKCETKILEIWSPEQIF